MRRLLSLGSVVWVRLSDQIKVRLVIAGYFPCDKRTGTVYDYSAVMYPWGMQMNPSVQMFNTTQILEVVQTGYLDEEGEKLVTGLPAAISQMIEETGKLEEQYAASEQAKNEQETSDTF